MKNIHTIKKDLASMISTQTGINVTVDVHFNRIVVELKGGLTVNQVASFAKRFGLVVYNDSRIYKYDVVALALGEN